MSYHRLEESLEAELTWRSREFSLLRMQIREAAGDVQDVLFKSTIVMTYANWEGFIKIVMKKYIEYINSNYSHIRELKPFFARLLFKEMLSIAPNSSYRYFGTNYEKILDRLDKRYKLHTDIETKSNLNKKIFLDILYLAGFNQEKYGIYLNSIAMITDARNALAHGQRYQDIIDSIEILHNTQDNIKTVMELFIEDIIQSCRYKLYLVPKENEFELP